MRLRAHEVWGGLEETRGASGGHRGPRTGLEAAQGRRSSGEQAVRGPHTVELRSGSALLV